MHFVRMVLICNGVVHVCFHKGMSEILKVDLKIENL